MLLSVLDNLWQQVNHTGSVARNYERGNGWYTVWFKRDSKGYDYHASTVYALAERLDMIPKTDVQAESKRIVSELASGASEVIASPGCWDMANNLWRKAGYSLTVDCEHAGTDRYDRPLARFHLVDWSDWD